MVVIAHEEIEANCPTGPWHSRDILVFHPVEWLLNLTTDHNICTAECAVSKKKFRTQTDWIPYITTAKHEEEQNARIEVFEGNVFTITTTRKIEVRSVIKVWFCVNTAKCLSLMITSNDLPLIKYGYKEHVEYNCPYCNNKFKNPYPYLCHTRHLCKRAPHLNMQRAMEASHQQQLAICDAMARNSYPIFPLHIPNNNAASLLFTQGMHHMAPDPRLIPITTIKPPCNNIINNKANGSSSSSKNRNLPNVNKLNAIKENNNNNDILNPRLTSTGSNSNVVGHDGKFEQRNPLVRNIMENRTSSQNMEQQSHTTTENNNIIKTNWCISCQLYFEQECDFVNHLKSHHKEYNNEDDDNHMIIDEDDDDNDDEEEDGTGKSSAFKKITTQNRVHLMMVAPAAVVSSEKENNFVGGFKNNLLKESSVNNFSCQVCGDGFKKRHHLSRHMKAHLKH